MAAYNVACAVIGLLLLCGLCVGLGVSISRFARHVKESGTYQVEKCQIITAVTLTKQNCCSSSEDSTSCWTGYCRRFTVFASPLKENFTVLSGNPCDTLKDAKGQVWWPFVAGDTHECYYQSMSQQHKILWEQPDVNTPAATMIILAVAVMLVAVHLVLFIRRVSARGGGVLKAFRLGNME
eukprot:TRINITY_DN2129_c0_g2_i3.p1 TRINITY_DN2129_c0_g2~~TRINITY_DN2129_c0_g2_i3.p1  ORF type:complete len:190 (+),score=26.88 TRINITY_DN2129_c0_g2_i3:29-571(+)